ncbi:MAG TPA: NAD(P)/FAD-dependent oxidoreductase [Pseudolabrys sp.]|nr:NAD(P)/FAD-dependent oxidoreductase [Pseudolabrys sp.]
MTAQRKAEIVGAGFAGLAAACALAQRGWKVRVHERADRLRAAGAGIYIYENGLRVLEALGAYDAAVATAPIAHTREVRDENDRLLSLHRWDRSSRVFSIVRLQVIHALAAAAVRAGAEIVTGSEGVAATMEGCLTLATGEVVEADLIVAADGVNSSLRDSVGLLETRRKLPDGATRLLIEATAEEMQTDGGTTVEYWSGSRRILYTPCSGNTIYIALTMLDRDETAKAVPIDARLWTRWFPHLSDLMLRMGGEARYDRFEYVKLKRWAAGRVVVLGDAAHALPPNIGQGAGCAMMNALALGVFLDQHADIGEGLAAWEKSERPITDHTQRVSLFLGLPTTWPAFLRRGFFQLAGRSKWLIRQRTRTAHHRPTGTY